MSQTPVQHIISSRHMDLDVNSRSLHTERRNELSFLLIGYRKPLLSVIQASVLINDE